MAIANYTVTGMTCGHCVRSVIDEVGEIPGVTEVDVDLATGRLTVSGSAKVDAQQIRAAVHEAGYEVTDAA